MNSIPTAPLDYDQWLISYMATKNKVPAGYTFGGPGRPPAMVFLSLEELAELHNQEKSQKGT